MDGPFSRVTKAAGRHPFAVIGVLLVIFMALAFALRLIDLPYLVSDGVARVFGADPWYNLRQIESMAVQFPNYNWFDPMTAYPQGKVIDWGPLFPFITTGVVLLAGAAGSRYELIYTASFVPPLMAALTVPLVFLVARRLCDWKAGLIAAGMIAIIPGGYLFRTSFGFVDHHAAEVLFSTLFCLAYILALYNGGRRELSFNDTRGLAVAGGLALAAGVAYLLGLLVMPTMILFALIVALYTLAQFIADSWAGKTSVSLAFTNIVAFGLVLVVYTLFMVQRQGMALFTYSIAHSYMYALLIAGTLALFGFSVAFRKNRLHFLGAVIVTLVAALAAIAFLATPVWKVIIDSIGGFFGQSALLYPISEMEPLDLATAWTSFNWGLVLLAAGLAVLCVLWMKKRHPWHLFTLAWAAVIIFSTVIHARYEYYLAPIVAITSGVGAIYLIALSQGTKQERSKGKEKGEGLSAWRRHAGEVMILLLVLFTVFSLYSDVTAPAEFRTTIIPDDWASTMDWISVNTPDPGVDYLGKYTKDGWTYPAESYGIISLWDSGHWITFLGKRIPNSNPFQDNVLGRTSTTAFLMAGTEKDAQRVADRLGSRFVITDIKLANTKFENTATWYNSSRGSGYYTMNFLAPVQGGEGFTPLTMVAPPYYSTMIARLQDFDGSMATPSEAYYIEYRTGGEGTPVVTRLAPLPYDQAVARLNEFSGEVHPDTAAGVFSVSLTVPLSTIPALQHYRLVYESPGVDSLTGLHEVKVFERVKGAEIQGDGVIELDLVTNQGRTLVYRQESVNGTFTVPYSTSGNPYPVRAVGPYRIVNSGRNVEVTEEDVQQGRQVR
ncbi:dolichyl-diphosphooligosaccharide--protein glycosyltransferase [Methanolinea mesophila]|uniref:oligosaccharyl transferase, archaeosortase A system-associated n=1 Tax=Methanolinea mesophila TaxID=547055 RepID=UPI001AE48811|nr:oligosaccharyl transferase, archaeosortase A system-associated [Methanolinea mesophila]MBP1928312.1 dolichyl-diphosphooligosaccharide--protein glycosyltransferase [Methanolinea mesophila]